jgi:hypothetical protein
MLATQARQLAIVIRLSDGTLIASKTPIAVDTVPLPPAETGNFQQIDQK